MLQISMHTHHVLLEGREFAFFLALERRDRLSELDKPAAELSEAVASAAPFLETRGVEHLRMVDEKHFVIKDLGGLHPHPEEPAQGVLSLVGAPPGQLEKSELGVGI